MKTPHKHAELIKAWADGSEIQIQNFGTGTWHDCENPTWALNDVYRIKPAKQYPASSFSEDDLSRLLIINRGECKSTTMARIIADAAVRRYIQDKEEQCTK